MKYVRTVRGYEALKLEDVTVTGTLQEVANDLGDKLVKAGEVHGVEVVAFDSPEAAAEVFSSALYTVGAPTPDLSQGVGAVTGRGAPVETFDGDEPAIDTEPPARGRGDKNQEK
jgi:hypothetical protein